MAFEVHVPVLSFLPFTTAKAVCRATLPSEPVSMNNLNPPFMKNFFKLRSSHYSSRKPYDLKHVRPNQVTFGSNSLESVGPQIWNGLPNKMKSAENLKNFKLMIKEWNGPECKCSACCSFTFTEQ